MPTPPAQSDLTPYVEANLKLSGIAVEPAWIEPIVATLAVVLDHAARVQALAPEDEAEPAPVFEA